MPDGELTASISGFYKRSFAQMINLEEKIEMFKTVDDPEYWVNLALQDEPLTRRCNIDVVNNQGTITLSGTVPTEDARQAAERVSKKQRGVVLVVNELKVA
jgi:osmotically-inducible protein OsmY